MSAQKQPPRPWPMKWIVLAILVCIVPYTWLTLRHRKPGPAHLPYADNKARAEVARLRDAGFHRFDVPLEYPSDPDRIPLPSSRAAVEARPGGLPVSLSEALIDKPSVPSAIGSAVAADRIAADEPFVVQFTCSQPDHREQLDRAYVFVQGEQITITPRFERLAGELLSRTRDSVARLELRPGLLAPGEYAVTLVGSRSSLGWRVHVGAPQSR